MSEDMLTDAYRDVLEMILPHGGWYEGVEETPARAARALREMTDGYNVDVAGLFKTFDTDGYDELVIVKGIEFTSLCEHHLLPFIGTVAIGYLPNERIVGLSKLARLTDAYARRLQVQERMTMQIADAIEEHLNAFGVIVVVEANHLCMGCRGVRKPDATAITSVVRGTMHDNHEQRAEALALLR